MSTTPYHLQTLRLLGIKPGYSTATSLTLTQIEFSFNLRLPISFRQWFEIKGATDILARSSSGALPIPIEAFGQPLSDWLPNHILDHNLLPFLYEKQRVCTYAIQLDSLLDPPVMIAVDTSSSPHWLPCASHFSRWLHTRIHDHLSLKALRFQAHARPFTEHEREILFRSRLLPGYTTYGWPGSANYRYSTSYGTIIVWSNTESSTWMICSNSDTVDQLFPILWQCCDLSTSLTGISEADQARVLSYRETHSLDSHS